METILIVGAGLAGASVAQTLKSIAEVVVVDQSAPGSGASGAASGMMSPFSGRKAPPYPRRHLAVKTLHTFLKDAGVSDVLQTTGAFNPAADRDQAAALRRRSESFPGELEWIQPGHAAERWPDLRTPLGGLWIRDAAILDIPRMINAFLQDVPIIRKRVTSFGEDNRSAWVTASDSERLDADYVILAPGSDFIHLPPLSDWPLGRVKGQTIRVSPPMSLTVPTVSGKVQIIPGKESWLIGSTFQHSFEHENPTDEDSRELLKRAISLVPALCDSEIVEAVAGVRATVPAKYSPHRLPVVGPIGLKNRLWAMVGLGSKGLLGAPLLATYLRKGLSDPSSIPDEVRIDHIIHKSMQVDS